MVKDAAASWRESASFLRRSGLGWVDPYLHGTSRWVGDAGGEALRMRGVRSGEHGRPRGDALLGEAVMHVGGRQQAEPGVMVLGVVPGEKDVAVGPRVLDRTEPLGEGRPLLQRLELRLRERVVVGDVWACMSLGHAEIGEQKGDGLRGHRWPAICVDGELSAVDALAGARLADEPFGERGALAMGHRSEERRVGKECRL